MMQQPVCWSWSGNKWLFPWGWRITNKQPILLQKHFRLHKRSLFKSIYWQSNCIHAFIIRHLDTRWEHDTDVMFKYTWLMRSEISRNFYLSPLLGYHSGSQYFRFWSLKWRKVYFWLYRCGHTKVKCFS